MASRQDFIVAEGVQPVANCHHRNVPTTHVDSALDNYPKNPQRPFQEPVEKARSFKTQVSQVTDRSQRGDDHDNPLGDGDQTPEARQHNSHTDASHFDIATEDSATELSEPRGPVQQLTASWFKDSGMVGSAGRLFTEPSSFPSDDFAVVASESQPSRKATVDEQQQQHQSHGNLQKKSQAAHRVGSDVITPEDLMDPRAYCYPSLHPEAKKEQVALMHGL